MRVRIKTTIDIYTALTFSILHCGLNTSLYTSILAATVENNSGHPKCDALSYLLHSTAHKIGHPIEILIALPKTIMYCAADLTFSQNLIAIKSCSKKDWNIESHYSHHRSLRPLYVFFACEFQVSVSILNSTFQRFILRFRWFIFYDSSSFTDLKLLGNLSKLDFRLDSFLQLVDESQRYKLQEAYKLSNDGGLIRRAARHWDGVAESSRDLQGIPLRVTSVLSEHFQHDTKIVIAPDGSPVFQDSMTFQILQALQFAMNFSIKMKVTHSWGDFNDETKSWEGMIAHLLAGEADLAISSVVALPFRRAVVDFNMPTNVLKISGFFKKPQAAANTKALIEPFKGIFWFVLICTMLCLGLVLIIFKWILVRTMSYTKEYSSHIFNDEGNMGIDLKRLDTIGSRHNFPDTNSLDDPQLLWCPSDCFQWALAALCNQGYPNIPEYSCYRIVIGMGCLSGVILYGAYAGTLISFLSVAVDTVTSVEQLLANSFIVSVVSSNLTLRFLRDSPIAWDRIIYQHRRQYPMYESLGDAKTEILRGSFVFVDYQYSSYNALNNEFSIKDSCSIQELIISVAAQRQGSMVPKNSPYKRKIDFQILRMTERGGINRIQKRFIPTRVHCNNKIIFDGVQLASVSFAFAILLVGVLLATFIIMVENGRGRLSANGYRA